MREPRDKAGIGRFPGRDAARGRLASGEGGTERVRWLSPAIAVILVAFMAFVVISAYWGTGEAPVHNPASLGGIPLTRTVSGSQAVEQMTKLHGTDIGITDGYILYYESGGEQAILWIGVTAGPREAQALFRAMVDKMKTGENQVFTTPTTVNFEGRRYEYTTGLGMSHYFYYKDNGVYWLGVKSPREEQVLRELAEHF